MLTTSHSLLQQLHRTDGPAWARFVGLYTPLLYAWARRTSLPSSDIDDLVQDVLVCVCQKLGQYHSDRSGSFRGWLKTITMNRFRELWRRRAGRPGEHGLPVDGPTAPEAEAFWEQEYRQQLVACALRVMKTDFQATTWRACWLQVIEDRSPAEVAAELDMPLASVYSARSRVLKRLRETLVGLLD